MPDCSVVALWGADHPDLGAVATRTLGRSTAIALSRGRFPKPYHHVDPNEDAALAAAGPRGRLIAVADGHNGFDAAQAAMHALQTHVPALLASDTDPDAALREAFEAASARIATAVAHARGPRRNSRTALSVALVGDGQAWVATLGDTAVVRVRGGRAKILSERRPFLGPGTRPPPVERVSLRTSDRVVAVSDGVIEYAGSGWDSRLAAAVADAATALDGVNAVVDLALLGGAGDHIAVAATSTGDGHLPPMG